MKRIITHFSFMTAIVVLAAGAPAEASAHDKIIPPEAAVANALKTAPSSAASDNLYKKPAVKNAATEQPEMPVASVRGKRPIDFRRTLFVPVGQKTLVMEAPRDMCFLDRTSRDEGRLYTVFSEMVRRKGGQQLLAVFMPCNDTVNAQSLSMSESGLPGVGMVTWMNPSIGDATALSRQDYLDMREASFLQYVENNADGMTVDKAVRRTADGVSLGMTGEKGASSQKIKSTAILATTALRQVPIEVSLHYTGAAPPPLEQIYPLMDKFMQQQVTLNP